MLENLLLMIFCNSLLVVLGTGVYCSSVVKDLFCSPRPYSPPVTRLSKLIQLVVSYFLLIISKSHGLSSPGVWLPFYALHEQRLHRPLSLLPCLRTRIPLLLKYTSLHFSSSIHLPLHFAQYLYLFYRLWSPLHCHALLH